MQLRGELQHELYNAGYEVELLPGDAFQPAVVEFPSYPMSDFLWPSTCGILVPPRVRSLMEGHNVTGVEFHESVIKKVGSKPSNGPIQMPEGGEPEDVGTETVESSRRSEFGPLFEMVVSSESGYPPGVKVVRTCTECGNIELDTENREFVLKAGTIPEVDIFFLGTTQYVIANQKVADLILRERFSNVALVEVPVR